MKKTSKTAKAVKAVKGKVSDGIIAHRIDALVEGRSVELPGLGVVKCVKAARHSKDRRRKFSLTKSTVAENRRDYTFRKLVDAFGLHV